MQKNEDALLNWGLDRRSELQVSGNISCVHFVSCSAGGPFLGTRSIDSADGGVSPLPTSKSLFIDPTTHWQPRLECPYSLYLPHVLFLRRFFFLPSYWRSMVSLPSW